MSSVYQDPNYDNLVHMDFTGRTWQEFDALVTALMHHVDARTEPCLVIFKPEHDIPTGNPLPPMNRIVRYTANAKNLIHMYAVVPKSFSLGVAFGNIVLKVTRGARLTIVASYEEAMQRFHEHNNEQNGETT
jgi:hypothetical protein